MDDALRKMADRLVTAGLRALARTEHPDAGGSTEAMQRVNLAAEHLRALLTTNTSGATFTTATDDAYAAEPDEEVRIYSYGMAYVGNGNRATRCVAFDAVRAIRSTPRALLIEVGDDAEWFPFSQIAATSRVRHVGDEGVLVVSRWIAEQKGYEIAD